MVRPDIKKKVGRPIVDIVGDRFGRLTVVRRAENTDGRISWLCQCDCGNTKVVRSLSLRPGGTQSCGCLVSFAKQTLGAGVAGFKTLFSNYRRTAQRYGRVFELSEEQFRSLVTANCFYCDLPPQQVIGIHTRHKESRDFSLFTYNGIDRIYSDLGYSPSNVRTCCKACNFGKRDRLPEEFESWLDRLAARTIARRSA